MNVTIKMRMHALHRVLYKWLLHKICSKIQYYA